MDDQQRARELLERFQRLEDTPPELVLMSCDRVLAAITAALRAAPEGFVLVPVVSVVPCDCGCHRHCCRYCGYDLGGLAPLAARPQGVKE